jgi:lipopolysaccharide transport system ATP-binding protein
MAGGEQVELRVVCRTRSATCRPIVAFAVRDRFRQVLFSDSTYLSYRGNRPVLPRDATLTARFRFRLPYLPTGIYALEAMLFDGDGPDEKPMCRYQDADALRIESTHISQGMVNVAMRAIEVKVGALGATAGGEGGRTHLT